jgi:hypothetical protein
MGLQPAEGKWEGIFFPINFFVAIFMSIEKKCQEKIFQHSSCRVYPHTHP